MSQPTRNKIRPKDRLELQRQAGFPCPQDYILACAVHLLKIAGLVMGRRLWAGPSIFDVMGRGPARPIKF